MTILLYLWLGWILGNLALMVVVKPRAPSFNGFWVTIPADYRERVTFEEWLGLFAHECGHRHHGHVWKNFVLICLFCRPGAKWRVKQELEADDYAVACGHGLHLATAIRKLSDEAFDNCRARRLEILNGRREAGNPNARDARVPLQGEEQ